jgi:ABC-2 type transport system ATP-binding protein
MVPAVQVSELTKVIKEKILVDRVSFHVEEGEVFGLLGGNGSGKTTVFNMLSGLLEPSSGSIIISGKSMKELKREGRPEVGMVPQQDSIYETLTVKENIEFCGSQFRLPGKEIKERMKTLLEQVKLSGKSDALAASLSGGMKKRLNIACSLIHDPKVVFFDEPTVGLDPVVRKEIWDLVKKLHSENKTIIITSHYMDEIEELCDRVGIMFMGRMVAAGTPAEIKAKYKLKQMEDVFAHLIKENR